TSLLLTFVAGDRIEGRVSDQSQDALFTEWPENHGLAVGDSVEVEVGNGTVTTTVLELLDATHLRLAKPRPPAEVPHAAVVFTQQPSRLDIEVPLTRITIDPRPTEPPCCDGGCCDDRSPLGLADRLRALLAALLYGRLVQRNVMLGADVPA